MKLAQRVLILLMLPRVDSLEQQRIMYESGLVPARPASERKGP
jgi:hypothetical protein